MISALPRAPSSAGLGGLGKSDPSFIAELCRPFVDGPIDLASISISLLNTVILPKVSNAIYESNFIALQQFPKLVRQIVDAFESDGLCLLLEQIIRPLELLGRSRKHLDLYLDIVSSIPSRYRDDFLISRIEEMCVSPDPFVRILSANVITLVRCSAQVAPAFTALAQDADCHVRLEVVNLLKVANFENSVFEAILRVLSDDSSDEIRQALAAIYGDVAPHDYEPYSRLLQDRVTMESALKGFLPIAEYSGFAVVFTPFCVAIGVYPKTCARILVELAQVPDPRNPELLLRAGRLLRHCPTFVNRLFTFSAAFESKRSFLSFFKVEKMKTYQERVFYAKQCLLFVPALGSKLLGTALAFAHDEFEEVRAAASPILVAICRADPSVVEEVRQVIRPQTIHMSPSMALPGSGRFLIPCDWRSLSF
jgi:hypothetical protein